METVQPARLKIITLQPFTGKAQALLDETDSKYVNRRCASLVVLNTKKEWQDGQKGGQKGELGQRGQGWPL